LNKVQKVQVSDTTGDAQRTKAGHKKLFKHDTITSKRSTRKLVNM